MEGTSGSESKRPKIIAFSLDQLEVAGKRQYPGLVFTSCMDEQGNSALMCSRRELHNHPPLGLISRARIVVNQDGVYNFQVVLFSKEQGSISTVDEYLELCGQVDVSGGYKFCPGFDPEMYKTTYYDFIRYDPKSFASDSASDS